MPATCESCGAEIIWVKTRRGKWMPIDRDPVVEFGPMKGNLVLLSKSQDAMVAGRDTIVTGHASHFATCPNANKHRKRQ